MGKRAYGRQTRLTANATDWENWEPVDVDVDAVASFARAV